jgi:hypothetical protein
METSAISLMTECTSPAVMEPSLFLLMSPIIKALKFSELPAARNVLRPQQRSTPIHISQLLCAGKTKDPGKCWPIFWQPQQNVPKNQRPKTTRGCIGNGKTAGGRSVVVVVRCGGGGLQCRDRPQWWPWSTLQGHGRKWSLRRVWSPDRSSDDQHCFARCATRYTTRCTTCWAAHQTTR